MNIYDFDKTIYNGDSTADFFIFSIRKKPSLVRFLPGAFFSFCKYAAKRIDKTAFKEQMYHMFSGFDAEALLDEFWDLHQHRIFPWYYRQQEKEDIVISASPEFLLRPICRRLGIQHLIASRVDVKTGKYTGKNCWGPEKVIRLNEQFGITQCDHFYSDSYSDQPLADIAEQAFLIRKGVITPWE